MIVLGAAVGSSTEAYAQCTPGTGSSVAVSCTGTVSDQGPGVGTGYGDGTQTGVTLTVEPGASVTGTSVGINLNSGSTVINAGTITGGNGTTDTAIWFHNSGNTLKLTSSSVINGVVLGGVNGTFQLGGTGNATLDVSLINSTAQYRGFTTYQKVDDSIWTLTGTTTRTTSWQMLGGVLSVSSNGNLGAGNGTLTFDGGTLQITGTAFTSTSRTIVWGSNGGGIDIADASNIFSLNQVLTGIGPLVKTGDGTLVLSGASSYSGGTAIDVGTLRLGVDSVFATPGDPNSAIVSSAVGTGVIIINGATLQAGINSVTLSNAIVLTSAGGTIDNNGNRITLAGPILDAPGTPGQLVLSGGLSGLTIVSSNNGYAGGTIISGTTVQVRNDFALSSGAVTLNDAQFQVGGTGGAFTVANNFSVDNTSFGSAIDNNGKTLTLTGNITGDGALTFLNSGFSGRTILLGTNNYGTGDPSADGTTVCFCATLQLGNNTTAGSITGRVLVEGTLDVINSDTSAITKITNDSGITTFWNSTTASAMQIENKNSGETVFQNSASAASATITNQFGGTTYFQNSATAANATITNQNFGITFFTNSATAGSATIINGSNGATYFGTPFGGDAPTAGNATITTNAGGFVDFNARSTGGNATITTNDGGKVYFFDNATGGAARFITNDSGFVDFSGSIGLNSNGRIRAGSIEGSGTYYIGSGDTTLVARNTLVVGGNNLSTEVSGLIADTNPCGCAINPGPGTLEKVGTGTLTLSGINTYTGGTRFIGGTVSVSQEANLGDLSGPLTFNGGILQITGTSFTSTSRTIIWGPNGGGFDIADAANTFTVTQTLDGAGPLTKLGAGTLQLLGANSYSGGTTVSGGTLAIASDDNIGTGPLALLNGSTLQFLNGFTFTHAVTVSGDPTINVPFGSVTMSSVIADGATPGDIVKTGAGTLIFTASNTYTGGTTVSAGALQLGTAGTAGSIVGPVTVGANGFLDIVNSTIPGVTTIANDGFIDVSNTSTLGSAVITNNSGIKLSDTASAGSATIANNGLDSLLRFFDSSTAGNATVTNGGFIQFSDMSSAGSANITNSQNLSFFDSSTAANARITNTADGLMEFQNASSAGSATILNSGDLSFIDNATAASATITSATSLSFFGASTAANAAITNNGYMFFYDTSTAANATITNNYSLQFNVTATAGNATIVTNDGASTMFFDNSTGGNAQFITNAGGTTDFSGTVGPNGDGKISAGSIAGAGDYYLGSNQLTVGGNNRSTTVSGVISDCGASGEDCNGDPSGGSLVKAGTGTLTLTGANTYTGGTTISAGMLQLGDGGTSGSILGNVVNNAIFAINRSDTYTFDGVISGPGAFQQNGSGRTILTATSTYTGATTVNAGTLSVNGSIASSSGIDVNNGAIVGGTGTLPATRINAGGALSPGNSIGTITVAGNLTFVGAGNYMVEVSPAAADRTNVTGTATLAGTIRLAALGGTYIIGTRYVLLNAASVSGTFGTTAVTGTFGFNIRPDVTYDANNVYLTLDPITTPAPPGTTPIPVPQLSPLLPAGTPVNPRNVAAALDPAFTAAGTAPGAFLALFNVSVPGLPGALSQLSGEIGTGAAVAGFQDMEQFLALMLDPFLENRVSGNAAPFGGPALAFAPESGNAGLPDAASAYGRMPVKAPPLAPASFDQRWTVWGAAYGSSGSFNGNAAIGSHDLTTRSGGFAGGIDYRVGPNTVIGFAASGSALSYNLDGGLGSGSGDAFKAGVYASTRFDNAYLSASAAYGNFDLTTKRSIILPGAGDRLIGDVTAHSFGGRIEAGYRFPLMTTSGITPYAAFQAQSFRLPGYGEADATGLAAFALTYNGHSFDEERSELGARFDSRLAVSDNSILLLRGRLAWAHEFSGDPALVAGFVTLPGTAFTVTGAGLPRDSVLVSAGPELRLPNGWTLRAKFDGAFSGRSQTYAGTGTLRFTW